MLYVKISSTLSCAIHFVLGVRWCGGAEYHKEDSVSISSSVVSALSDRFITYITAGQHLDLS
jgi:hypothetical protein